MRKNFRLILSLAGCTLAATATGQPSGLVKRSYSIPFRLTPYNTIILQAVLNGRDTVQLMWHTAASDVTLTEDAAGKLRSVGWEGKVDSVRSWGGGNNVSEYSRHNSMQIAGMGLHEVTIWKDLQSGRETGGKIGLHFFAGSVVEMDFDRDRIIVERKLPRKVKKYTRLPLIAKGDLLLLPAGVILGSDTLRHDYLLHSGYAGDVLLDDAFVAGTGMGEKLAVIGEKKLTDAFGHIILTKRALLPLFWLGGQALTNVPAGFFQGTIGRQQVSVVGCDILKRFDWIVDAERAYIYLKPSKRFYEEYPKG